MAKGDTLQGCRADSCWSFGLPAFADSVKIATKGQGEFTLTGIFLDNPFPGISVTGIGVNGASLGSYSKCPDLMNDLRLVNPDLVVPDSVEKGEIIQNVSQEADEQYQKNWTEFKAACD